MHTLKNLLLLTVLASLSLTLFSYSYVDLNLTLINNKAISLLISNLQNIAYYNRSLATFIYLILDIFLFSTFWMILIQIKKTKSNLKQIIMYLLPITLILCLAYPFLSSDIFNYMFDAKIILHYHLNPYTHRALDFPSDDWIRFMRWTHRYSPYGPGWLLLSLFPSILGFGKFIVTLFAFKIYFGIFHILNTLIIYRILTKAKSNEILLGVAFYAFNPLLLIEGVINGHNDVILATSLLAAAYFIVHKNIKLSATFIFLGFLIKYLPLITLPNLFLTSIKKIAFEKHIELNILALLIFTFIISTLPVSVPFISKGATQVQFQPWYLFWTVPYISLLGNKKLMIIAAFLCFGASLRYLPYLYYGDWTHFGTIIYMQTVTILPAVIVTLYFLFRKYLLLNKNV